MPGDPTTSERLEFFREARRGGKGRANAATLATLAALVNLAALAVPLFTGEPVSFKRAAAAAGLALLSVVLIWVDQRAKRKPMIVVDSTTITGRTMWGVRKSIDFSEIDAILFDSGSLGLECRTRRVVLPYAALSEADRDQLGAVVRERMAGAPPDPILLEQGNAARKARLRQYGYFKYSVILVAFLAMSRGYFPGVRSDDKRPAYEAPARPRPFDASGTPVESRTWPDSEFTGVWRQSGASDWIEVQDSGAAVRCHIRRVEQAADPTAHLELLFGVLRRDWRIDWSAEVPDDHLWKGEDGRMTMGHPGRSVVYDRVSGWPTVCRVALADR